MDPMSVLVVGAIGYWVFRALTEGQARPPTDRSRHLGHLQSDELHPPVKRRSFTSAAECFSAEYVSYSRLRCYSTCPHKFRLAYLKGVQQEDYFGRMSPGKDFHTWCEHRLRPHIGEYMPTPNRPNVPYIIDEAEDRYSFIYEAIGPNATILAVEHELRYTVQGINFFGIVDLVVRDADGITHLVDFKTGGNPRCHLEQLEMYCLLVLLDSSSIGARCSFLLVDCRKRVTWDLRARDRDRDRVVENIFRIVKHMRDDTEFAPNTGSHCRECGVGHECEHRDSRRKSVERTWPRLTPAKSGVARLKREAAKQTGGSTRRRGSGSKQGRAAGTKSLFMAVAQKEYKCDETGATIQIGEQHVARKNGCRLSMAGFHKRFPGVPLPSKNQKQLYRKRSSSHSAQSE